MWTKCSSAKDENSVLQEGGRRPKGLPVQFDFLGFNSYNTKLGKGGFFLQYDCNMSRKSKKRILKNLRGMNIHAKTQSNLQGLAIMLNPKIRGWINYYGKIKRNSQKHIALLTNHQGIKK
ncbi:MAG: group II intron maturase-specific domain-containing protein [Polaribacter sp.]|uniref:group II intron maturase-specific domain-containing protein n=1 Tax=Polaribacter sp. TaxID=1920175 RepID=UPI002F356A2D